MNARNLFFIGLAVSLLAAAGCSSSSSGSSPSASSCKNPTACDTCMSSMCSSENASVESTCGATFVSCYEACDCSDDTCIGKCFTASSASCQAALSATTCTACNSECSTTSTSDGGSGGPTGGSKCFATQGTGTTETCAFAIGVSSCTGGESSGSCPSASLAGCCVTTVGTAGGGNCYYDSAAESDYKSTCTMAGGTWSTTAP